MAFWSIAYKEGWCTIDQLRLAVKTETNPYGQITKAEFKAITGEDFDIA